MTTEDITQRLDAQDELLQRLCRMVEKALEARPAPDAALTVGQVAERLGVSTWTVYQLDKSGKLPAARIGKGRGVLRFSPALVDQYEKEASGNPLPRRRAVR